MIVCATRGGEASLTAQDFAIRLALEGDEELVFFYVSDTGVLERTSDTRPHEIAHNLARLGEFILTIAQERAEAAGVEKVRWECRIGAYQDEMRRFLQESGADKLVLGRPDSEGEDAVFSQSGLDDFAAAIVADMGVQVLLPDDPSGGNMSRPENDA